MPLTGVANKNPDLVNVGRRSATTQKQSCSLVSRRQRHLCYSTGSTAEFLGRDWHSLAAVDMQERRRRIDESEDRTPRIRFSRHVRSYHVHSIDMHDCPSRRDLYTRDVSHRRRVPRQVR